MFRIWLVIALLVLAGCSSKKSAVSSISVSTDSIGVSVKNISLAVRDSIFKLSEFHFDTLCYEIERPSGDGITNEIVRIKTVNGKLRNEVRVANDSSWSESVADSVCIGVRRLSETASKTSSTGVVSPPNGTALGIFAIVVAGVLFFLLKRES